MKKQLEEPTVITYERDELAAETIFTAANPVSNPV